jgi:hypothetical protein
MIRGAVLTGIVFDHAGQPVPGVAVAAMRYVFSEVTGERILSRSGSDALTDDQGTYRCYGLAPGDYLVMASLRSGPSMALMDLRRFQDTMSCALAKRRRARCCESIPATTAPTPLVGPPVFFPGTPDPRN